LIVSEITNPFFPEIVQTFETLAVEQCYEILLTSTIHDPKRMELAVRRMIESRVDGVAILTFGMEDYLLEHLRFRNLPLLFVDIGPKAPRVSNIRVDYADGIRQAVQHLAALRHEQIGFITGPLTLRSAVARRDAFETSMREIGLPVKPDFVVEGDHRLKGGKQALQKVCQLRERPTAILCSNDMTAIGVMREAFELGIKVPQELSVIGFDDIRMAEFLTPPLTTVQMSQSELAKLACEALLKEVKEKRQRRKAPSTFSKRVWFSEIRRPFPLATMRRNHDQAQGEPCAAVRETKPDSLQTIESANHCRLAFFNTGDQCESRATRAPLRPTRKSRSAP
jgi:LacI family transcriptional regulator